MKKITLFLTTLFCLSTLIACTKNEEDSSSSLSQSNSSISNSTSSTSTTSPIVETFKIQVVNGTIQGYDSSSIEVLKDEKITIVANEPKENEEFKAWQLENGNLISISATFTFKVNQNMILTATYQTKIIHEGITIYFSPGFANDVITIIKPIVNVTESFVFPKGYQRLNGCEFLGWALDPSLSQPTYLENEIYQEPLNESLMFYAIWDELWTPWL